MDNQSLKLSPIGSIIWASMLGVGLSQGVSHAANIQVTSNLDDGTNCTLRDAVVSVNSLTLQPGCVARQGSLGTDDTITFASDLASNDILLESEISINRSVELQGEGITVAARMKDGIYDYDDRRIFNILSSTVVIDGLSLTGGYSSYGRGAAINVSGATSIVDILNSDISQNSSYKCGAISGSTGTLISISNSKLSNNVAFAFNYDQSGNIEHRVGDGGAICADKLIINESEFSYNIASGEGGAIFASSVGLHNSILIGNRARVDGGSVRASHLTIEESALVSNSASGGGAIAVSRSANILNSTISGNTAGASTSITGPVTGNATIEIANTTISDNSGPSIITTTLGSSVGLLNTIAANSNDASCFISVRRAQYGSPGPTQLVVADNNSIIEDQNCVTGGREIDPGLLPLANNGGSTPTHALSLTSPARNTGDPLTCTQVDQRGVVRKSICDVGAFEDDGFTVTGVRIGNSNRDLTDNGDSNNSQPILRVRFSDIPFDPPGDNPGVGDVTDETNYRLIMPGDDNVFESNTSQGCLLGLQGDDIAITINKATYVSSLNFTRLDVNDGKTLASGKYSLLVCASNGSQAITDPTGRPLDGDGDGTPGDDFVLNFTVSDNNELCFPIRLENNGTSLVCL